MITTKKSQGPGSRANGATEEAIIAFLHTLGIKKVKAGNGRRDSGAAIDSDYKVDKPKALIINGDALDVLRRIKLDSFVDTVVSSPPYWRLRPPLVGGEIGQEPTIDEYLQHLVAVFNEVNRVIKESGSLWINLGDRILNEEEQQIPNRFALLMRDHGWILHKTIIWSKPNYNPAGRRRNFPVTFEHIFWFVRSHNFYWNLIKEDRRTDPVDEAIHRERKRDTKFSGQSKIGPGWSGKYHYGRKSGEEYLRSIRDGRAMIDVWTIPSACHGRSEHTEPFPLEIPRRALNATCPSGGVTMDPFSGVGTTGSAALEQGKNYIGIEVNPAYANLSMRSLGFEISIKRRSK